MQTADWSQQFDQMTKAWIEAQTQILESWTAGAGTAKTGGSAWRQTVDAWKAAVDSALDAQAAWAGRWAEAAPVAGGAAEVEEWARQGRTMFETWIASQRQLWTAWFQTLRGMDPTAAGAWSTSDRDALKLWQDTARQMAEMQAEWYRKWTTP